MTENKMMMMKKKEKGCYDQSFSLRRVKSKLKKTKLKKVLPIPNCICKKQHADERNQMNGIRTAVSCLQHANSSNGILFILLSCQWCLLCVPACPYILQPKLKLFTAPLCILCSRTKTATDSTPLPFYWNQNA